jgi:hypothetical protein
MPAKVDANYIRLDWVEFMSTAYFRVIDAINDCYKKMLEIGKCMEVFLPGFGPLPDILTCKSKQAFTKEKENISRHYNQYVTTGTPRLTISIDVEIVSDPKKYANSKKPMPAQRTAKCQKEPERAKNIQKSQKKKKNKKTNKANKTQQKPKEPKRAQKSPTKRQTCHLPLYTGCYSH